MKKGAPSRERTNSRSALTRALNFEKAGKRYFTMSAAKCADPFAKQVFELLARMEEKHFQDIQELARRLEEEGRFPAVSQAPFDARMRLFRKEQGRIRKEKVITGDAVAAMRKALAFEAEGREMYARLSRAATHPQEKKFFRLLSAEEDGHFHIIYEYLDFLEDQGLRMGE